MARSRAGSPAPARRGRAAGRRPHHRDRSRPVALGDGAEPRRLARHGLAGADVAQVLQVARGGHQRHQPARARQARPGVAPRVGPVPQQIRPRHAQHRQHEDRPRTRHRERHAAGAQEAVERGPVEPEGQPREVAHPGGLLAADLEALYQGGDRGGVEPRNPGDRADRHDPRDQAAEGHGMSFGQRPVARRGGVRGGRIDGHVADQEDPGVGRGGGTGRDQGGAGDQGSGRRHRPRKPHSTTLSRRSRH